MVEIQFRKPYKFSQIISVMSNEIEKNGFTNTDFCVYTKEDEEIAYENLICYVEVTPTIVNDEEVYSDFIMNESLEFFCDGQQFEDVLMNVLLQKKQASMGDFIQALNYYLEKDSFLDL